MNKITTTVMATLSGLVLVGSYLFSLQQAADTTAASPSQASSPTVPSATTPDVPASSGPGSTAASPAPAAGSGLIDGTYTGDAASTRYGDVQVAITVADGRITDVQVPQFPTGGGREQSVNARALPQLVQETIQAQSANIDMVSGATYTMSGYRESLQSAIDQADAASTASSAATAPGAGQS